jgi:hypothetical protein
MVRGTQTVAPASVSGDPVSRSSIRRPLGVVAVVAASALVIVGVPVIAEAASTPTQTTFVFSGAVQGTLTQSDGSCTQIGGYGGTFDFASPLKGSKNIEWTVNVNNLGKQKHGGTFKKFTGLLGNGVSIVLQGSNGKTDYFWITKSGTLTITPTSGHLKVVLGPDQAVSGKPGKGTIYLTGSWGCIAS